MTTNLLKLCFSINHLIHINLFDPSRHKKNIIFQDLFYSFIHSSGRVESIVVFLLILLLLLQFYCSNMLYYIVPDFFNLIVPMSFFFYTHKGSMNMNINKKKKRNVVYMSIHTHTQQVKSLQHS